MGDNRTLIVRTVVASRGAAPSDPSVPKGPHVQESLGNAGPAPTFEDLLSTPHDEDLFDYYATAQLAWVDSPTGKASSFGAPGLFTVVRPSPDQSHLLVGRLHKPYSYQLSGQFLPAGSGSVDHAAKVEYKVASLPLAEHVPMAGVRTGPRAVEWIEGKPATLTWVEALDGGNPKETVPNRDRILALGSPFKEPPREVYKTKDRFRGMQPLAGGKALVEDYERTKRTHPHGRDRSGKARRGSEGHLQPQ